MKLVILNGSPKGELSVTLQYINFIQKKFPEHEYQVFNISQQIKKYTENPSAVKEVLSAVRKADGIIWSTPVYFLTVPSQLKRFIEVISEDKNSSVFRNKYAAVITTSINFFDYTANNYLNAVCDDLGMKYAGYFSAEMYDLMRSKERERLNSFIINFFDAIVSKTAFPRHYGNAPAARNKYKPGKPFSVLDPGGKKVVIVSDTRNPESNSYKMAKYFASCFSPAPEIISLDNVNIKGGCLGCCECGPDNNCKWGDSDDYINFYNTQIRPADILVFAGEIRNRWLSWQWKQFMDRSFFNTHVPVMEGRQLVWIVSGPLSYNGNIRDTLQGITENGKANLVDILSDEENDSRILDKIVYDAAALALKCSGQNFVHPRTFLGIGGHKVFRDAVWGSLRFVFQVDHKYYKSHGHYDFPQKNFKVKRLNFIMMTLTKIPAFRRIFVKKIKSEMVKPLQKKLETIK